MKSYDQSDVKKWGKGYFCDTNETHLLLNGGKLRIPIQEQDYFLRALGKNIDDGVRNFVCENRTPIFQMHADLDILEPSSSEMTCERFLRDWVPEIQSVMRDFYESSPDFKAVVKDHRTRRMFDTLGVLVCMGPLKRDVERNRELWTKTGVHLVWPWIQCTSDQAEKIRSGWIQHFEKKFGKRQKHNIWEDIFDACVYRSNGLRMVGQDKMERCPHCKGKRSTNRMCPGGICDGEGKYPVNRLYGIVASVDPGGKVNQRLKNFATQSGYRQLKFTSTRSSATSPTPMNIPAWFDENFFQDEAKNHKSIFNPTPTERKQRRAALGTMPENVRGAEKLKLISGKRVTLHDQRFLMVQRWLKDAKLPQGYVVPDVYRKTEIVDLTRFPGDRHPYYIARTDSHFCLNKAAEHNRNNIYFLING